MLRLAFICRYILVGVLCLLSRNGYPVEWTFESDISTRVEYNDNIFLTTLPHDSVSGIVVSPSIEGIVKERNWDVGFKGKIRSHHYSDHDLDTNDLYLSIDSKYYNERDIFALNVNHDLDSNLNSTSSDFGIVGRRINRKYQSISPQYTRLINERLSLLLGYSYLDVDYLEADSTGFTPYVNESIQLTLAYDVTEIDKFNFSLVGVDYKSRDNLITYEMLMTRAGIEHKFNETFSMDFLIGVSRQNSTNLTRTSFDFFGNTIITTQEIDVENRGLLLDFGMKQLFESSDLDVRVTRDNRTNSFGGLDRIDRFTSKYNNKLSKVWRYYASARYEDITSISAGTVNTDRTALFLETTMYYSFTKSWDMAVSYRYIQRKFKDNVSDSRAPHSNRIYFGLAYNFPAISTF